MPTPYNLKRKWIRRLGRLHAALQDVEATRQAMLELAETCHYRDLLHLEDTLNRTWFHRDAVVLRAICRKGPARHAHKNASLEALLEEMSANASVLRRFAREKALASVFKHTHVSEAQVRSRVNRDLKQLLAKSEPIKNFGDNVAHLLIRPRKIKGARIRRCREHARVLVDRYYSILTGAPPAADTRDAYIQRVLADIERLTP